MNYKEKLFHSGFSTQCGHFPYLLKKPDTEIWSQNYNDMEQKSPFCGN